MIKTHVDENVHVVGRFRPVNTNEKRMGSKGPEEIKIDGNTVSISTASGTSKQTFCLDQILDCNATQEDLGSSFHVIVDDVLAGYNGTILAYGQTGSGKTHTMLGPPDLKPGTGLNSHGVIPRASAMIFDRISKHRASGVSSSIRVSCSFIEIYQEEVQDLLASQPVAGGLRIREDASKGAHIEGLSEHNVTELKTVWDLLSRGLGKRKTASTMMNENSSRSHSLFIVTVTQEWADGTQQVGKLHLGDLAGSENVKKSQVAGTGFVEAAGINKSLSALGGCINALTEKGRRHIPYRDSRLTFLLKESLGGNAKTTLIVTCSSHSYNLEERAL